MQYSQHLNEFGIQSFRLANRFCQRFGAQQSFQQLANLMFQRMLTLKTALCSIYDPTGDSIHLRQILSHHLNNLRP